jgi:hypothetical protein
VSTSSRWTPHPKGALTRIGAQKFALTVEAAILEALEARICSDEVILNILSRRRRPSAAEPIGVLTNLRLSHPPKADCSRYDQTRGLDAAA